MAHGRVYYVMVPEALLRKSRRQPLCFHAGYFLGNQHRSNVLVVCRGRFGCVDMTFGVLLRSCYSAELKISNRI